MVDKTDVHFYPIIHHYPPLSTMICVDTVFGALPAALLVGLAVVLLVRWRFLLPAAEAAATAALVVFARL